MADDRKNGITGGPAYSRGAYRYTYEVFSSGGRKLAGKRPICEEDCFSDGDDTVIVLDPEDDTDKGSEVRKSPRGRKGGKAK